MNVHIMSAQTQFEKISRLMGLVLLAPLLALATIPVAVHISQKPDFGFAVHQLEVWSLVVDGPAQLAGLQAGDKILQVNGTPIEDMSQWFCAMAGNYELTTTLFMVSREGLISTVVVSPRPPQQMGMIRDFSMWVAGLAFLIIGWWVFSQRNDLVARNFFALCIMFAFLLMDIPDLPRIDYMVAKGNLRGLVQLLLPAYFLRFFLQFPSPHFQQGGSLNRWRSVLWPGWIIFSLMVLLQIAFPKNTAASAMPTLELMALGYSLLFFAAGLVIFTKRILRKDRPIQRTKMLVILAGLLAGFLPFMAAMVIATLAPEAGVPQWQYLAFSLLLVPVSFALAIMRYGALDKSFVLRISLIYGLLTAFVLLVYFVIVVGLGQLLAGLFSVSTYPVLLLVVAASSLTILPLRRVIQGWIDDTFYPGRKANRQALIQLGQSLTALIDADEVIQELLRGLNNLFFTDGLTLFIHLENDSDNFQPHFLRDSNFDHQIETTLSKNSNLVLLLNRLRRPIFSEEMEDLLFSGDTDPDSLSLLTKLNVNLLLPLISANRLLGFLAFSPKSSGALYTQEDLSHLSDFSLQAGSLLDSRLLYQESLQQKRTETELELARTIQNGLLPDKPLETSCFVIAGMQESCRKVGGDYFDFFMRSDGTLCFALADVSGKGIPAALHMTSLRVAFRQEAEAEEKPHLVIKRLNNTVFNLVTSGQFICFFYGMWNPENGILTYCNAGSEPPILRNPLRGYNQSLRKGGPVLGVTDDFDYLQGAVQLEPQDRLFLYTDGLTDQQNLNGDFFDLPRLQTLLSQNDDDTPVHLLERIFSSINAFGGAEKTDDKTAICLEIKKLIQ